MIPFARRGALVAGLLISANLWAAGHPTTMIDPLLGLSFDPDMIHFEFVPKKISTAAKLGQGDHWVFASYAAGSSRYYIVSGHHAGRAASGEAALEPDFGDILRVNGNRVEKIGTADRLFQRQAPLPSDVVDGLMRDAASRYTVAFDGAGKLNRAIRAQDATANQYPPVLIRHMEENGVILSVPTSAQAAGAAAGAS